MYRWYRDSRVCYAYLSDITVKSFDDTLPEDFLDQTSGFTKSRWFTRGWTLQELLAPNKIVFVNKDWERLGTKISLKRQISIATGIKNEYLFRPFEASVAAKMSWVSRRRTTRLEDIAYCLMGLFEVEMPLLYGEGKKAFMRLQYEIIRISNDESIFAWTDANLAQSGMFALSPASFAQSANIVRDKGHESNVGRAPYAVTNRGLAMELFLEVTDSIGNNAFEYTASFNPDQRPRAVFAKLHCGW